MVDRYRVWLGAGVLAGGVSAAMLAGAGVAVADEASSSSTGTQASPGARSGAGASGGERHWRARRTSHTGATDTDTKTPTSGEEPQETVADAQESSIQEPAASDTDREPGAATAKSSSRGKHRAPDPETDPDPETESEAPAAEAQPDPSTSADQAPDAEQPAGDTRVNAATQSRRPTTFVDSIETDLGSGDGALVMRTAAAEVPPLNTAPRRVLNVLNNIGAGFYNFYTNSLQALGGPVRAPFGSRVRVESSTLTLGEGKAVPADWYFPNSGQPPTGLIYLQHGFLAGASLLSATAAYLAEKTDSIVVAPTLTWNFFDIENYPLEWPATGRAIADLFTGDRAVLNASAQAAGFAGILPTRVVLAGHSAGGGLVAMVAGDMAELGTAGNLAGVVMFDGVGTLSPMSRDLAKIPRSIPVYNLAAEPSSWNWYGDADTRLAEVRPDMFTGVKITGGHHSDAMQSTSFALQFVAYLATGFSSPRDIRATKVLAAGWINDMFAGTRTAQLYDGDGSPLDILSGLWWRQVSNRAQTEAARRAHPLAV